MRTRACVCVCVALPCIHVFMLLVLGLYSGADGRMVVTVVSCVVAALCDRTTPRCGELTRSLFRRNIDLLVRFPGLPQRRQLTYAAKQLIGREASWSV